MVNGYVNSCNVSEDHLNTEDGGTTGQWKSRGWMRSKGVNTGSRADGLAILEQVLITNVTC